MKYNILLIHLHCFLALLFLSLTVYAKDIKVKSPGNHNDIQPAIQQAVKKALDGDRIILPEGEFVINRSVRIEKFISFIGMGLQKTILYRPESVSDAILSSRGWEAIFLFNIRNDLPSHIVVSGICFRGKKPSVVKGDGGSEAPTIGIKMVECVGFIIENCRFEYFGNAAISIRHKDTLARGLIRHNEFYYNARFGLGYGVVVYGSNNIWVADPKFGSANFIFVEDNIFDFHRHSIAANACALFVFRYNTVLNNIAASGGHAIDTHAARGKPFGVRAVEVYNNKLLNTTYTDSTPILPGVMKSPSGAALETAGIAIRNGEAVVFNNDVRGYTYAVRLSNWYLKHTVQSYPVTYGPGYGSGLAFGPEHSGNTPPESEGDVFIWNNTSRPYLKGTNDTSSVFRNFHPEWWKVGRDYHLAPKPRYKPYTYPYPVNL